MYWLISLPLTEGRDVVWTRVQSKVKFENDLSQIYRFKLPELRVGTLDSLLALSDDLVKVKVSHTSRCAALWESESTDADSCHMSFRSV